jgi:predicted NBD/HSP70 family sugar kinase
MEAKNELLKKKIIKNLYYVKTYSSAELSEKIEKSLPLTTRIVNELIEEGIVIETGYAPSTGGRRPVMYSLAENVLFVVSVAMDQFITRIAIMDMTNEFVFREEKFELSLHNNSEALPFLVKKIEDVVKKSGIPLNKIAGAGIGMPGFVDVKKGINHSFLHTTGKSLTEYISDEIKLPVFIDNDSSLIALAELKFGAARCKKNAMVINAGWGVGLGMILNGDLFRGNNGFAGEFSHLPLFNNNKLCFCGKTGCLETEASLLVVVEKAQEGLRAGRLSQLKQLPVKHSEEASEMIIHAAHEGDRFAIELLSEAGYKIGRGVAILIHLLNPEVVILSGRGSLAGKIWNAPIQHAVNEHCIPRLAGNTSLEISTLGYKAELIGAAALVMENYEKQPLVKMPVNESKLQFFGDNN